MVVKLEQVLRQLTITIGCDYVEALVQFLGEWAWSRASVAKPNQ